MLSCESGKRLGIEQVRPLVTGDLVRDWQAASVESIWLYDAEFNLKALKSLPATNQLFWPYRSNINKRKRFGTPMVERGFSWYEWQELYVAKLHAPLTITFAFVATHNHFVLDRGGKVFNRSAPVIKLPAGASEAEHLGLLGLLNSSVACFWLQQLCHNKGGPGGGSSKDEKWHDFYEFTSTKLAEFPLVEDPPVALAETIERLVQELGANSPAAIVWSALPTRATLDAARSSSESLHRKMIAAQEELDWRCNQLYGLTQTELTCLNPPEIACGERAFEIVMARRMLAGEFRTSWFEWLKIKPVVELPSDWPDDYRRVVGARIALIESDRSIGLVESPNCKRRWESSSWVEQEQAALRGWLLARLESPRYWTISADQPPALTSTSRLADAARQDADFMQMATLYAGHADFDPSQLVAELVLGEAAPFLPVLRYTDTGLRKRAQWEDTWALQRREDAGEDLTGSVGKIPVPPKYQSKDFLKTDVWRLRGGLDVPKERWISYPGCERGADGSLIIAWAGWSHLQQATALAGFYVDMKDNEGWPPERLQPLLAGLLELVPWLEQWHNEIDPNYGERMGHYYKGFVAEEARALGFTLDDLRAWKPAVSAAKRGRKKSL